MSIEVRAFKAYQARYAKFGRPVVNEDARAMQFIEEQKGMAVGRFAEDLRHALLDRDLYSEDVHGVLMTLLRKARI